MLMKLRKMLKSQQGFTLIELLVVIAIIGALAGIAVPKFMDSTAAARTAKVQADLGAIDTAITLYGVSHNGAVPDVTTADFLTSLNAGVMPTPPATGSKFKIAGATAAAGLAVDADYSIVEGIATISIGGTAYNAGTLRQ